MQSRSSLQEPLCDMDDCFIFLRQLKIEGATSLYISKLSTAFFSSIIETGKEFEQVFSANRGFSSGQ